MYVFVYVCMHVCMNASMYNIYMAYSKSQHVNKEERTNPKQTANQIKRLADTK